MHIAIIGTGYVGLVTGTCFAEFGVEVTCVDKDESKITPLLKGEIPIYEPGLQELVKKNINDGRLRFTTDLSEGVKDALVVFIAVGTPPREDGSADLSHVLQVAGEITECMDTYKVIVTKSTVPVGTGEKVRKVLSKRLPAEKFDVASNPEFLREGSAIGDFMRPDRVIIGAETEQARAILRDLYRPLYLIETPFVFTNVATAELIKYASNAFLATKITFINEMANLCEQIDGDVHVVAKAMGLDGRIGPKFLRAGPGYGGSCFPKDTLALLNISRELGHPSKIVKSVVEVNDAQKQRAYGKIKDILGGDVKGKVIGLLGLAFKPNTDDFRESPAEVIIRGIRNDGGTVQTFDPAAMDQARSYLGEEGITFCENSYDAVTGADVMVVVTEWNQFRLLDLNKCKKLLKSPNLVDLRNVYEPKAVRDLGFNYTSIGRV
ncbi:MAG: UDP-glucose/GDP-mannose dehydrogenase family protein [bacterium]|nr:UDP-glucose/GDP-mannose dehydrogenase family protein [bacterium]MDT8366966.1 UDP-glucose/GDP-mannose dehydrogenase family protein [bacterium]